MNKNSIQTFGVGGIEFILIMKLLARSLSFSKLLLKKDLTNPICFRRGMDSLVMMTILLLAGLHLSSGSPTPNEIHQFVPLRKYFTLWPSNFSFIFNS